MATYAFDYKGQQYAFDHPSEDLTPEQIYAAAPQIVASAAADLKTHQTKTGPWNAFKSSVGANIGEALDVYGEKLGLPEMRSLGESFRNVAGATYEPTRPEDTGIGAMLNRGVGGVGTELAASGIGSMFAPIAGGALASMAAPAAIAAPVAAGLWGATTYPTALRGAQARQAEVNKGQPIDQASAETAALIQAGIATAIGPILGRMVGGANTLFPAAMEKLAPDIGAAATAVRQGTLTLEDAVAKLAPATMNYAKDIAVATGVGAGMGVSSEAITRAQAGQSTTDAGAIGAYGESLKGALAAGLPLGVAGAFGKRGAQERALAQESAQGIAERDSIRAEQQAGVTDSPEYLAATQEQNAPKITALQEEQQSLLNLSPKTIANDAVKSERKDRLKAITQELQALGVQPVAKKGESDLLPGDTLADVLAAQKAMQEQQQAALSQPNPDVAAADMAALVGKPYKNQAKQLEEIAKLRANPQYAQPKPSADMYGEQAAKALGPRPDETTDPAGAEAYDTALFQAQQQNKYAGEGVAPKVARPDFALHQDEAPEHMFEDVRAQREAEAQQAQDDLKAQIQKKDTPAPTYINEYLESHKPWADMSSDELLTHLEILNKYKEEAAAVAEQQRQAAASETSNTFAQNASDKAAKKPGGFTDVISKGVDQARLAAADSGLTPFGPTHEARLTAIQDQLDALNKQQQDQIAEYQTRKGVSTSKKMVFPELRDAQVALEQQEARLAAATTDSQRARVQEQLDKRQTVVDKLWNEQPIEIQRARKGVEEERNVLQATLADPATGVKERESAKRSLQQMEIAPIDPLEAQRVALKNEQAQLLAKQEADKNFSNAGAYTNEREWNAANPDEKFTPEQMRTYADGHLQFQLEKAKAANTSTLPTEEAKDQFHKELAGEIAPTVDTLVKHSIATAEEKAKARGKPLTDDERSKLEDQLRREMSKHVGNEVGYRTPEERAAAEPEGTMHEPSGEVPHDLPSQLRAIDELRAQHMQDAEGARKAQETAADELQRAKEAKVEEWYTKQAAKSQAMAGKAAAFTEGRRLYDENQAAIKLTKQALEKAMKGDNGILQAKLRGRLAALEAKVDKSYAAEPGIEGGKGTAPGVTTVSQFRRVTAELAEHIKTDRLAQRDKIEERLAEHEKQAGIAREARKVEQEKAESLTDKVEKKEAALRIAKLENKEHYHTEAANRAREMSARYAPLDPVTRLNRTLGKTVDKFVSSREEAAKAVAAKKLADEKAKFETAKQQKELEDAAFQSQNKAKLAAEDPEATRIRLTREDAAKLAKEVAETGKDPGIPDNFLARVKKKGHTIDYNDGDLVIKRANAKEALESVNSRISEYMQFLKCLEG